MFDIAKMETVIYVTLSLVALVILVAIGYFLEARYKKKLEKEKKESNHYYKKRLKKIKRLKTQKKKFSELDKLSREFFKDVFDFKRSMSYSEMSKKLKKGKKNEKKLCEILEKISYDKNKITKKKIEEIVDLLEKTINKNNK